MERKPEWLRVRYNRDAVNEVAEHARPETASTPFAKRRTVRISESVIANIRQLFMILGSVCTRNCRFCNVTTGRPLPPDPEEPENVALAAKKLGLRHVVLTCSTRDDLPDGGAEQFAKTVAAIAGFVPLPRWKLLFRI